MLDQCASCEGSLVYCDGRHYVYGLLCCTRCSHHTSRLQPGEPQQKGTTMVKSTTKKAEGTKRTMLTPAQRVAKAEAELARIKELAAAKETKAADKLRADRAKLVDQIKVRQDKVDAIDAQLGDEPVFEDTPLPIDDSSPAGD